MARLQHSSRGRQGVILLVVISLLVLFSLVGIAFVIYAESQANTARIWREGETFNKPNADPELLLSYFLSQLIYDTDNPQSALRGHSLARSMYGKPGNTVPFNGTGRIHSGNGAGDDWFNINYTQFGGALSPDSQGSPNPPYTYPDMNNVYLAAQRASDGAILIPSYQRLSFGGDPANHRHVLRPLPSDHSGFPAMADAGGDVKNIADSPGTLIPGSNPPQYANNDSVWLDLGFPVMKSPDGRKFKPLFAPLVLDLDNRVNVNVHGNKFGTWNVVQGSPLGDRSQFWSTSEEGWAPWEVNPMKVVQGMEGPNEWNGEWRHLLLGNGTTQGRYDQQAWFYAVRWPVLPPPDYWIAGKFYSMTDANCHIPGKGNLSVPGCPPFPWFTGWYSTPGCPGTIPFPSDQTGYGRDNFTGGDETPYPNFYNYFDPTGWNMFTAGVKDKRIAVSNMEALMRYRDSGSPALTSDLFRLCPLSFGDPQQGGKARRLVTTHAFDYDRPGVTATIWNPQAQPYRLQQGSYPTGDPIPFPGGGTLSPPSGSEFGPDGRSVTAALSRIDLCRKLPDYPTPDQGTNQIAQGSYTQFQTAQQARQDFAKEIFITLQAVTGAQDPTKVAPDSPDYNALRWLAQLAVNIVDFIDNDDYMTPFNWTGTDWVFGSELPRVVVNEVYSEITNDSTDMPAANGKATKPYKVKFWAELHNPFRKDNYGNISEGSNARLQTPGTDACYQLVIATTPNTNLRAAKNILGDPDPGNIKTGVLKWQPEDAPTKQPTTGDYRIIQPATGSTSGPDADNQGFYVVGPKDDFPGTGGPNATLRVKDQQINGQRSSMVYELPVATDLTQPLKHTLLLRRLACPAMPPQTDATQPNYNPYVTVDYVEDVVTNDGVANDSNGMHQSTQVDQRKSTGRNQPYAGDKSQRNDQSDPNNKKQGQPQHTFFKVNYQVVNPFDWLLYLDRPPFNPMELLQVSAFKPHELTQQFMTGGVNPQTNQPTSKHTHRAPWFDQTARIFRVFEFMRGGMRMQGAPVGGRTLGKININNVWDVETMRALYDARPSDYFLESDVDAVFANMIRSRTPGGSPGSADRPFRGMAAPITAPSDMQYPVGSGIDDTFFRTANDPNNPNRRLFEVPMLPSYANGHPYLQYQMMEKIFGNVTTRSNVFAVYLTVGFFEVVDDSNPSRPPVLGAEIGRSANEHIRHRMFAIVDRSNLTMDPKIAGKPGSRPFFMDTLSAVSKVGPQGDTVTLPAIAGKYEELGFQIQAGDLLTIDVGMNQEVVTVTNANIATNQITAAFGKKHQGVGIAITNVGGNTLIGNPGPQPRFDIRNPMFSGIVRHSSIIE